MRHVALLRSINVGTHNRVSMVALKEALAQAGLQGLDTYLQSGNVLFDAEPGQEEALERAFESAFAALNLVSEAIIRSPEKMARVVEVDPFEGIDVPEGHKLVTFLKAPSTATLPRFSPKGDLEVIQHSPSEIWSVMRPIDGRPANVNLLLEKGTAKHATTRNWTVTKDIARLVTVLNEG